MSNTREAIKSALSAGQVDRIKLARRYYALCDLRDAAYAEAEPLERELTKANEAAEQARLKAADIAAAIEAIWGPDWIALKREIGDIANILKKIPPRDTLLAE